MRQAGLRFLEALTHVEFEPDLVLLTRQDQNSDRQELQTRLQWLEAGAEREGLTLQAYIDSLRP